MGQREAAKETINGEETSKTLKMMARAAMIFHITPAPEVATYEKQEVDRAHLQGPRRTQATTQSSDPSCET